MTPDTFLAYLAHSPYALAYVAGCASGWLAARRATRYMLGGRL